ncbi:MAG: hypothetical protein UIH99_00335 [Alphaproteobacteria bacterium]|nr:hypothetical protein [Alphaproteobacteria bacterium]
MKQKIKNALLTAGAVAVGALGLMSCGESQEERQRREQEELDAKRARHEAYEARQDSLRREQERQDKIYYNQVRDSVLNAMNFDVAAYDSMCAKDKDLQYESDSLYFKADSIKKSGRQWYLLQQQVDKAIEQKKQELVSKISKYCDENFIDYSDVEWDIWPYSPENLASLDSLDLGVIAGGVKYPEYFTVSDKRKVWSDWDKIASKAAAELIPQIKEIEKRYIKYYPVLGPLKLPKQYQFYNKEYVFEQGGESGIDRLDYSVLSYRGAGIRFGKVTDVYDSKLQMDFFNQPGAKYELKSLGNNQWQVVRTSKNGKVAKTHVFTDKGEGKYSSYISKEDMQQPFSVESGTNIGVRIRYVSDLYEVKAENDTVPDIGNKRQKQLQAIEKRREAIRAEQDGMRLDSLYNIEKHAESMARYKLKQRQNSR